MFRLARRNIEIDRRTTDRHPLDDHRPSVDELRRRIAPDVHMPIETGLADADRNTKVGGKCRYGGRDGKDCCKYQTFHDGPFVVGTRT